MEFCVLSPSTDYMTGPLNRRDQCTGTGTVATMKCVLSINAILLRSPVYCRCFAIHVHFCLCDLVGSLSETLIFSTELKTKRITLAEGHLNRLHRLIDLGLS